MLAWAVFEPTCLFALMKNFSLEYSLKADTLAITLAFERYVRFAAFLSCTNLLNSVRPYSIDGNTMELDFVTVVIT